MSIVRALSTLWSQIPTAPAASLVPRSLVERRRHQRVLTTWIDVGRASTAAIVHLHGGDYLRGETPATWNWLEEVRRRSAAGGAMVHYRMPPRFPFPTAVEDVVAALIGMQDDLLLGPGRWVLSGDGAGAGLALAVAQQLAAAKMPQPALLLLTAPWADLTTDQDGDGDLQQAARLYAGNVPADDPRISPLHGDLTGLPPVHLGVGTGSPRAADAQRLREALLAVGGEVEYVEEPGADGDFPVTGTGAAAQSARRSQIAAVRRAVGLDAAAASSF